MIMTEPYRNSSVEVYCFLRSKPIIFRRFWISVLPVTCLKLASLTFKTFPFNGKTPKLSRPTTESPATAKALAESPSVKMSVHSLEFLPPAQLASSSLGMPSTRRELPLPALNCLEMSTFSFTLTQSRMASTTPLFNTCLRILSGISQLDPNMDGFKVSVSFVWESKAGFSIQQFTKIHKWFRTIAGFTSIPPLFFFLTSFRMTSTS
mmetsp:Transcript_1785/g.3892  ORF Transcript_1785/g.3892 Transcript_1785/m.3892 type:complete len:207 (+) Transcript_1785:26-646(+)